MPQPCNFCGKKFEPKKCSVYCSDSCQHKASYAIHKKEIIARSKQWRLNNPERTKERRKQEYWMNPELNRQKTKDYWTNHPKERKQAARIWRDKVRHGGKREKLIEENGRKCSSCGREGADFMISAHHLEDKNNHELQVLLCQSCHINMHRGQSGGVENEATPPNNG